MKIGFIGAGKMAEALIRAIKADVIVSDIDTKRLAKLKKIGAKVTKSNVEVAKCDVLFLAVKPQIIDSVLREIKCKAKGLVVSIAAGVKLSHIQKKLGHKRVVRVMPNTPCLVGEMAAGYSLGSGCSAEDAKLIGSLLNNAGIAVKMPEGKLDAVTGLSGSGPAFIAYMLKYMAEAGVKNGLDKNVAKALTLQTARGTAKLLNSVDFDELIAMVRSPNGTTHEGMKVLEKSDIDKIIKDTVSAATKRSKELGRKK